MDTWKRQIRRIFGLHQKAHETIKFTAEYSMTEVAFLDTLVYKLKGKLATKVYHKKTDDKCIFTTTVHI